MRSSPTLALCLLLAGAAQAQDLNVITGVEVKDSGNSVVVTVKGSKPPNFTTFSMADPARFVIDLSEARFQGVPEDMRVDDGVIRVVKNLAYGSGSSAIARVMIAFSADVEPPDVQTDGTSLTVKVAKPAGTAVAATGSTPAGASAAGAGDAAASGAGATAAAAAAAAALARSEADEAARQEALAREQREAEAREQARLAAEATAKEREAQDRAVAEARAREAQQLAAQQAAAEEAARVAADARRAEIKAKAAAETAMAQQLAAETPAATSTGAAAPAAASVAVAVDPAAQAEAERAARAQAKADARAKRDIEQALAAKQTAEGGTRGASAPPAAPPAATSATPPAAPPITAAAAAVRSSLAASAATGRPARLQAIGFKQLPNVSRVFVKTSAPSRFTISDLGDDVVRLEVENTRAARRNDTRPLDTSFFPSAVAMITPSKKGSSYVVDIKLRKRVPYQQKVEGDVVAIDFERPPGEGSPAGEAAPAAAAAGAEALDNAQGLTVTPEDKAEGSEPDGDPEAAPKQ